MLLIQLAFRIIKSVFTTSVLFLAALFLLTTFGFSEKYRFFAVRSGSMRPAISEGSLTLTVKQEDYQKKDIIAYIKGDKTVTHRIVDTEEKSGKRVFITKGDANDRPDEDTVNLNQILGKMRLSIPLLGRVVLFAKTQTGFILLIVIPGTAIAYSEIVGIKDELMAKFKNRKKDNEEKQD